MCKENNAGAFEEKKKGGGRHTKAYALEIFFVGILLLCVKHKAANTFPHKKNKL